MESVAKKESIKVAHLLLVHHDPLQVKRLLIALQHPDVSFFVHIDKKTDRLKFEKKLRDIEDLHYIKPVFNVNWGGYSIIEATLAGFRQILDDGSFTHINLLSGADYPIKKPGDFLNFLEKYRDAEFFEFYPLETEWKEGLQRYKQYHFNELNFPGKYLLQRFLNKIMPPRKMPDNMIPVGRLQWFTITTQLAEFLYTKLSTRKDLVKFFSLCWGTDEFLFQTLAYNSNFKKNMVNQSLRYVHFEQGKANPQTLTIADWDNLVREGSQYFARKFDPEISKELLNKINQNILNG